MPSVYEQFRFIHNEEIAVSSWVMTYAYVERLHDGVRGLMIEYLPENKGSGNRGGKAAERVRCFYPGTPESLFASMDAAGSKGKWVHANVINTAYEIVA